MSNKFESFWKTFSKKPCVTCAAKEEHIIYLQKLIDQLLIKNGFSGIGQAAVVEETPLQKRQRELEEKNDEEIQSLLENDGIIYGSDE